MDDKELDRLHQLVTKGVVDAPITRRPIGVPADYAKTIVQYLLKDYDIRPKTDETPEHPLRWNRAIDLLHAAIFGSAPWDNGTASDEAHKLIRMGLEALQDHDIELADNWVVQHHRERKQRKGWRGRRLQACNAANILRDVIDELGFDDKTDTLNLKGGHYPLDPKLRQELHNQVATLLRMILLLNDGQVSDQKLTGF